jgi:3-hydroxyisobutyrate dehydrogenase-like beta-hydroxyacid dehydrogenase
MHKDMSLALDLANQLGVPLPSAAATREVLSSVKGATKEDVDFSALASFWKRS